MFVINQKEEKMQKKRYKFIVTYQALPTKQGKERKVNRNFEGALKRLATAYGYNEFIGSGYDFTNERRDMGFWG